MAFFFSIEIIMTYCRFEYRIRSFHITLYQRVIHLHFWTRIYFFWFGEQIISIVLTTFNIFNTWKGYNIYVWNNICWTYKRPSHEILSMAVSFSQFLSWKSQKVEYVLNWNLSEVDGRYNPLIFYCPSRLKFKDGKCDRWADANPIFISNVLMILQTEP